MSNATTSSFPSFRDVVEEARASFRALPISTLEKLGILQSIENYYLIGTYPPLKAMGSVEPMEFLPKATEMCSVYLHIPFCEQRCSFCHFAKEILPPEQRVERYMRALHRELESTGELAGHPTAQTVYFGGGTPSYLSPHQISEVFAKLRESVRITGETETTFELHPSVIDAPDYGDRLDAIAESGVNRWVFGVQSMEDRILDKLNRGHSAADVYKLLSMLADRGIDNLSVDLIYGLPYQNPENWYASIRTLVESGVEKFNIFPLMFKQADPISMHYRKSPDIFPGNEERLMMHFMTESIMKSIGFRRGPLFYYAKAEQHSRQQENKYDSIEDINLLPFGVSGFGYVGHTQFYNEATLDRYMAAVDSGRPPVWRGSALDFEERMRRAVMFPLRSGGVNRAAYRERYGADPVERFATELAPFIDNGLLAVDAESLQVTDVGAPFADSIAISLASPAVVSRVHASNALITDLKNDPVDRYDFSPIARESFGAGVSPVGRLRATEEAG
ncbi:coproporphyrinogen-III oxidase family protein [Streptomyces tirandamycinicus]|uniref:coproporphyrinogen-III oxidase family protein n=1 Tax=Streptomyces tirandamycinicus TaxID=2174846 RepID=UPI00226EDE75|nr:coproporphyrinogen-III oxidase family protein [Streptomyces tirandamycinicus]MCY0981583.1 coproporphyrinogen-III oxidase family protein [Streptomyces tirandamycinicus]